MNNLKAEKQEAVIAALVEGNSIRSTERMVGVHRDTIMRLLVDVGEGCEALLNEKMRNLPCRRIQVDEIWSFVQKKQRHMTMMDDPTRVGDQYTFVALDPETKIVPSYRIGKRDLPNAVAFLNDLSERLTNRIQLSSDALAAYVDATEQAFGLDIDYGQIVNLNP
jgi:transposase-like protein